MTKPNDLTNQRFHRLVAIHRCGNRGGHALWECKCDCGKFVNVPATNLKTGNTKSCGCFAYDEKVSRTIDITGKRFGILTVVSLELASKSTYRCVCDCGRTSVVCSNNLRRGVTRSCGCLRSKGTGNINITHGMSDSPEYMAWVNIVQRCTNDKHPQWSGYGGRGIRLCKQWKGEHGFEKFFTYVGVRPSSKHSIDRYPNNDGDYEPGNVRWATHGEQVRNRRNTLFIEYDGEKMCAKDFSVMHGFEYQTVRRLVHKGKTSTEIIAHCSK